MEAIERHEYIDRYLQGILPDDERLAFEEAMKNDKALSEEVEMQKLIITGIYEAEKENMKVHLQELEQELQMPNTRFIQIKKWLYPTLALAAVITGILFLIIKPWENRNEKLFAQNFTPLPNNYIQYSRGEVEESPIPGLTLQEYSQAEIAMHLYDSGQFEKVIPLLETLVNPSEKCPELLFYYSIAQLATGKTDDAIHNLEWLNKQKEFQLINEVKWYLALGYIKKNNLEPAKLLLDEIINNNGGFNQNAEKLKSNL